MPLARKHHGVFGRVALFPACHHIDAQISVIQTDGRFVPEAQPRTRRPHGALQCVFGFRNIMHIQQFHQAAVAARCRFCPQMLQQHQAAVLNPFVGIIGKGGFDF